MCKLKCVDVSDISNRQAMSLVGFKRNAALHQAIRAKNVSENGKVTAPCNNKQATMPAMDTSYVIMPVILVVCISSEDFVSDAAPSKGRLRITIETYRSGCYLVDWCKSF